MSFLLVAVASSLIAASDFTGATWLAPAEFAARTNATAEFRTNFRSSRGGLARLSIAADTVYSVLLNGEVSVITARLPDVPPERLYDVWDLKGTKVGENELLIRVYSQGKKSSQYLPGDPGLLFELKGEDFRVTSSDVRAWRFSNADRAEGVITVSDQIGFSFEYDAAAKPATWRPIAPADHKRRAEDMTLRRRPVTPAAVMQPIKSKIIATGVLDGSSAQEDFATGMDATTMTPSEIGSPVDPRHFASGFYYLIDLGREEAGLLELELDTDSGVIVDIGHAEHYENGRIRTRLDERGFAGRYRTRDGLQTYCRWQRRMAGRYLQLHVRGVRTHFSLRRATVRPVIREVKERQPPKALNERRREIWRTAVRTLMLSMHEHYEDCPWREQALYSNDSRNQIIFGRYAFENDSAFAALSLELMSKGFREDGWQELTMPAKSFTTIPSFAFSWVLAVDDFLRLYGDVVFVHKMFPTVKTFLERRLSELDGGLLPSPRGKRYWQFYDWSDGLACWDPRLEPGDTRFDSPLNLYMLMSLEAGARIADASGDKDTAAKWRKIVPSLRSEIIHRFWNAEAGRLDTYRGDKCVRDGHELVQALGLLADAIPDESRKAVAAKLSAPSDWVETTLSQSLFKYMALCRAGHSESALSSIDAVWGKMLDQGATSFWEMKEGWQIFHDAGSLCHGWSAVPILFYATAAER